GVLAGAIGPVTALALGGLVPAAAAGLAAVRGRHIRAFDVPKEAPSAAS
ncbi:MFS transporter, partial [Streptomyces sp. SID8361]